MKDFYEKNIWSRVKYSLFIVAVLLVIIVILRLLGIELPEPN